ncbi:Hsp33 family molecular chaperone HslO [Halieaceae bacterium IMCC14734]|uniref:33 kDa chaperonin n=1 Tax=Candidatus Litorirhabdus singularis TaxID=2518993 RepID=A0ABT3TDF2_9GAMM|nr:Hsp33 family molecular chaperone HslO [Candidatus Litorirhabdus singularis]MCX2979487.1 Hsp33 family molecular chaperone HslO [Candidatus Litorirhabdus singularis]
MSVTADVASKFVFEEADIRGEIIHLDQSSAEILELHQYPPAVARLLGEFLAAVVLLSTTIKFDGRMILQAQGSGEIPLLMAECNSELEIRGIARGAAEASGQDFASLLPGGTLAITIEPRNGQRYQGIVPLEGGNLAACLEHYFENSEQLATRLWLTCDGSSAGGLLLQQLPAQLVSDTTQRSQQWEHVYILADTVMDQELLRSGQELLLAHLFPEDPIKLLPQRSVKFQCSCSEQRCLDALASLGSVELEELFAEQEIITMDCEFCNQQYGFKASDLAASEDNDPARSQH